MNYNDNTLIEPGTNVSGMAYYVAEFYGDGIFNPQINDGKIEGEFLIKDIFGNEISTSIIFKRVSLEFIKGFIKNIENIR